MRGGSFIRDVADKSRGELIHWASYSPPLAIVGPFPSLITFRLAQSWWVPLRRRYLKYVFRLWTAYGHGDMSRLTVVDKNLNGKKEV